MEGFGLAVLRVVVAAAFIAHGVPKLAPIWGGGPAQTTALVDSMGAGASVFFGVAVGAMEIACALVLIAGAFTFWVTLALALDRVAALDWLHLREGLLLNDKVTPGAGHGYEYDLVLIAALVCLMLEGPGALSYDEHRARSAESRALGRARLRSGKV